MALSFGFDALDRRQMRVQHLDRADGAAADQRRQLDAPSCGVRFSIDPQFRYLPDQCTKRRSIIRNSRLRP